MEYVLSPDLWAPQARGVSGVLAEWAAGRRPILYSPTGGGKTRQAVELFKWAEHHGMSGVFYINRRLLIHQTSLVFDRFGLRHGVRAAECEDLYDPQAQFQIASADTEASRVIEKGRWQLHDADVVVVDEAHLQRTKAMDWILRQYKERGARIVLLTATPVEMGNWADSIVISGRLQEYRDCGALVPAVCKGISGVDLRKVTRNKTGEFVLNGEKKAIYTQSIVGDVIKYWKEFNPDARPTMVTWPGVAESMWGTEKFRRQGVKWVHVDATHAVVEGERHKLTPQLWQDISGQYRDGTLHGISNRFKCLDMETEVLCEDGWSKADDIDGKKVLSYDHVTGECCFEHPQAVIRKLHTGTMVSASNMSMSFRVTGDHEMLVRSADPRCRKWHKEDADRVAQRNGAFQVPVCVEHRVDGVDLTDSQIAFIGWMMTDGHRKASGRIIITQSTCKPEYIHQHIRDALTGSGVEWVERTYGPYATVPTPFKTYAISAQAMKRSGILHLMDKDFHPSLLNMNRRQLQVLLQAVVYADGSIRKQPSWNVQTHEVCKGNLTFLSRLQALCVARGMRAHISTYDYAAPRIYISENRTTATIRGATPCGDTHHRRIRLATEHVVDLPVWCVTTRLGSIVTRRHGKVIVLGNCREGIDLPNTYQMILATPIGSLASYLQTVGRALRYSPETPDHVLVTDHGGAYLNHGSPNHDRPWDILWNMSEHAASTYHRSQIKEGKKPESIVCPQCMTERPFGDQCPNCGHKSSRSKRRVVMESGDIVEHEGKMVPKTHRVRKCDTEEKWRKLYFAWSKNHPTKTFRSLEGWFIQKHGYRPTRDVPLMPRRDIDWFARLQDVPKQDLTG